MWDFSGNLGQLPLVATADDLDALTLEPVEEGLKSGAGHCADLIPDDHTGNELLSHPFGHPLCLATPVVGLGLDAPSPHFFRQTVGWGEDKRIPMTEEPDCLRGLAGAPAAVQVAQVVPRQRVIVARRSAGREGSRRRDVVRPGKVGRMLLGQVNELAFVPPLARGDRGE